MKSILYVSMIVLAGNFATAASLPHERRLSGSEYNIDLRFDGQTIEIESHWHGTNTFEAWEGIRRANVAELDVTHMTISPSSNEGLFFTGIECRNKSNCIQSNGR